MLSYIVVWAVLAIFLIALIIYRRSVANKEDETVHVLDSDANLVPQQAAIARQLDVIDRWGKIVTVVLFLYTLALGALYMYNLWQESSKVQMG